MGTTVSSCYNLNDCGNLFDGGSTTLNGQIKFDTIKEKKNWSIFVLKREALS